MDKNDTKFLGIALAAIVVMTISLTTFNSSSTMLVLAQKQEEEEFNENCANLLDKVKGLDRDDILELTDNGELQDLRVSLINCSVNPNLGKSLKPDDLEKLDPTVIGVLGPDVIINLIR